MILAGLIAGVLSLGSAAPDDTTQSTPPLSLLIVTSRPDSAEVFVDSVSVGVTPCSTLISHSIPHALLVLQSPANAWLTDAVQESVTAAPGDTLRRHVTFHPLPLTATPAARPFSEALDVTGTSLLHPPRWRLYLSGGGALLAGATAAYLKGKADDKHAEFLATRDPAAASARDRYDTSSTLFLVAAEVGFGLFLAFLLAE